MTGEEQSADPQMAHQSHMAQACQHRQRLSDIKLDTIG
jgi:hypothetical protein